MASARRDVLRGHHVHVPMDNDFQRHSCLFGFVCDRRGTAEFLEVLDVIDTCCPAGCRHIVHPQDAPAREPAAIRPGAVHPQGYPFACPPCHASALEGRRMALLTCPDCQSQISDLAPACPRCGRPQAPLVAAAGVVAPPPRAAPAAFVDEVIYQQGKVTVTRSRVVIGEKTYPMNTISAVEFAVMPRGCGGSVILLVIGIVVLIGGAATGVATSTVGCTIAGVVVFLLAFIGALLAFILPSTLYVARISSAGTHHDGLISSDQAEVRALVDAIATALARRA